MSLDISDVTVVHAGYVGLDGESADAARMAAIEADLATMLARPVITALGDIPDVDETGAAAGQAVLRNATNDGYELGDPSGAISSVSGGASTVADVSEIEVGNGLELGATGPGYVFIQPVFVGTGSANTVARSDHTHTTPSWANTYWDSTGNISSGTRTLGSKSVTLAAGVTYLVIGRLSQRQRGTSGSSTYSLRITIDGVSRDSDEKQCVAGVPAPEYFQTARTLTGTGAAITVSAAIVYISGSAVDVRSGELNVELYPAR